MSSDHFILQAFDAALASSNVSQLVVANMDIHRFKTVNTAKGDWFLLDVLSSTEIREEEPDVVDDDTGVAAKSQLGIADIERAVREVATGIIGGALEGGVFLERIVPAHTGTTKGIELRLIHWMQGSRTSNMLLRLMQQSTALICPSPRDICYH